MNNFSNLAKKMEKKTGYCLKIGKRFLEALSHRFEYNIEIWAHKEPNCCSSMG